MRRLIEALKRWIVGLRSAPEEKGGGAQNELDRFFGPSSNSGRAVDEN